MKIEKPLTLKTLEPIKDKTPIINSAKAATETMNRNKTGSRYLNPYMKTTTSFASKHIVRNAKVDLGETPKTQGDGVRRIQRKTADVLKSQESSDRPRHNFPGDRKLTMSV